MHMSFQATTDEDQLGEEDDIDLHKIVGAVTQLEEEHNTHITETEHSDYDSDYALEADQNNTEHHYYQTENIQTKK